MNWISIGKTAISFVASAGVGTVVTNAIKATTPTSMNTFNKVLVGIGGFVLSGMVAAKASEYVAKELEQILPTTKQEEIPPSA